MEKYDTENKAYGPINEIRKYYAEGDYQAMTKGICHLFLMAQKENNQFAQVAAHYYLGLQESELHHFDASIHALQIAIEIAQMYHFDEFEMRSNNVLGSVYTQTSDYYTGLDYYLKVFYSCMEHPEYKFDAYILNNLGSVFYDMEDYDLSLDYYNRSYQVCIRDLEDSEAKLPLIIMNIIETLSSMQKYDEVEQWFRNEEQRLFKFDEVLTRSLLLLNQAQTAQLQGDDLQAMDYLVAFLETAQNSDDYDYLFRAYLRAAWICMKLDAEDLAASIIDTLQGKLKSAEMKVHNLDYLKLRIAFCRHFHYEKELQCELDKYYYQSQEYDKSTKEMYRKCLRLKINIEKMMLEQNRIMKQNEELKHSVNMDPFTEIYNKVYVEEIINECLQKDDHANSAMLLLDIDLFKNVNDTYGHSIGDYVIKESVNVLHNVLRGDDIIGRVGGDEFVIFLNNLYSKELVYEKADLILHQIGNIYIQEQGTDNITVSIGICMPDQKMASYQQMFELADKALYEAKANGRNQFVVA